MRVNRERDKDVAKRFSILACILSIYSGLPVINAMETKRVSSVNEGIGFLPRRV